LPVVKSFGYNTVRTLIKYFLKHLFIRIESWFMFSAVLLIFSVYIINAIRSVTKDVFIVSLNIYEQPIFAAVIFVCVFSSFLQMLHVSRDIDSRIYESYLYGPVNETAYIISIFTSYSLMNFLAIVCFPFLWILLIFALLGIAPTSVVFAQIIFGYFLSNLILLIALCIGAMAKKSKLAIWYLLLFHVLCTGIVLGDTVVSKYLIPLKRSDVDMFSFFRNISRILFDASVYFSPYTQYYLFQKRFYYSPSFTVILFVVILAAQIFFALMSRYLFKRSIR